MSIAKFHMQLAISFTEFSSVFKSFKISISSNILGICIATEEIPEMIKPKITTI